MKKLLTITILTFLFITLFGQESKFCLGIELAPTYSSLYGNDFIKETHDSRLSFFGSLTAECLLNNNFSLKTGIGFERKGSKIDILFTDTLGEPTEEETIKFNFDYITLPLILRFNTRQKAKFYTDIGLCVGYLIGRKDVYPVEGIHPDNDVRDDYTDFDFGLHIGAGIIIPLSEKLRFELGLKDELGLLNTSKLPIANNGSIKTHSIGLLFGLKYLI